MEWWEFHGHRDKVLTLAIISVMVVMSTIDLIVDWVNYHHLTDEDFRFGLVSGPPAAGAINSLLVFNILATLLYFIELWNTTTVLTNARVTRIPIALEQGIVLLLEEIPMAAINLNTVTCRKHYVTQKQVAAGVFGMLNVFVRLYCYGWYRECEYFVKAINTFKTTLKIAIYVTVSVFVMVLLVTLGFSWRQPTMWFVPVRPNLPEPDWIKDVSIMLLPEYPEGPFGNESVTAAIEQQGVSLSHPWLVRDVGSVISHPDNHTTAVFVCHTNATLLPPECVGNDEIKFSFTYDHPRPTQPFGSIRYNLAQIKGGACAVTHTPLRDDWQLIYLKVRLGNSRYEEAAVMVTYPWQKVCAHPILRHDDTLEIC